MDNLPSKKAKLTTPRASRIRYTLELAFEPGMEERLERLKSRLQRAKSSLYITPRTPMGNVLLVEGLLDSFKRSEPRGMVSEGHNSSLFTFGSSLSSHDRPPACTVATQTDFCGQDDLPYVLSSGENTTGCFDVHTASKPDEAYFIASTDATKQILHTMARYNGKCPLCGFSLDTESLGFLRYGHAAGISLSCAAGHSLRWFSSSVISGKFTVNLRYVTYLVNFDEVATNFINQVLVQQKI